MLVSTWGRKEVQPQNAAGSDGVLGTHIVDYSGSIEGGEVEAIGGVGGVSINEGELGGDLESSGYTGVASGEFREIGAAGGETGVS